MRFHPILFFLYLISLSSFDSVFAADGVRLRSGLYFHFPACVPECTVADKDKLNKDNFIEEQVVAAIDSAKTTIDFSQFTFSRDSVFQALLRAADRGVQVRGIMDRGQFKVLAEQCPPTGCELSGPYVSDEILALKPSERLKVIEQNNLWPGKVSTSEKLSILLYKTPNGSGVKTAPGKSRLVHNKFVLVDSALLISGSGNWSSTGMAINLENIDTVYADEKPDFVKAFKCMADAVWTGDANVISKQLRECEAKDIFFTPSPVQNGIQAEIVNAMTASKSQIDISMHHLTNDNLVLELENALARNVKVRLLFDNDDCMTKLDPEIRRLRDAGAEVRYLGTDCWLFQLSHNKFGIFDGKVVINGSGNWSKAALSSNYENYIVYDNQKDVGSFQSFFEKAWGLAVSREQCSCSPSEEACRQRFCLSRPPSRFEP